jgi:hypothetical protein
MFPGEDMPKNTITTRPINENEDFLRRKFYETIVAQNELLDKISERLITLELAVPSLYVTILRLVRGDNGVLVINYALYTTFACWLVSLILTMMALFPRKWKVDLSIIRQDPDKLNDGLGIEDFYEKSANYKRVLLVFSSIIFFSGVFFILFAI